MIKIVPTIPPRIKRIFMSFHYNKFNGDLLNDRVPQKIVYIDFILLTHISLRTFVALLLKDMEELCKSSV
jgi:hypothetical protein